MKLRALILAVAAICLAVSVANATVTLTPLFSDHMVLQRNKSVPVFGTAAPGETVTVTFGGQTKSATADSQGDWRVSLDSMAANTTGRSMTVTGTNTITISDILVGDVWLVSGQSNMTMPLSASGRTQDETSANFPGIRRFHRNTTPSASPSPTKDLSNSSWIVCSPSSAPSFPATAFYFARKIYLDQGQTVPIGILEAARGSTDINTWVCPESIANIPLLAPLLQPSSSNNSTFGYFNSMVYPLEPYGIYGIIWWQGCSREITSQSVDSYYVKERAIVQGWRQLWGGQELPFYIVQLANYEAEAVGPTPDLKATSRADTRLQQANILCLPKTGMAVAIDVGDATNIHPPDKYDIGERLALWALKNDYGHTTLVESGPILKNVVAGTGKLICSFDYVGSGLMVGSKVQYQPTQEVVGGTLTRFSIAGADGIWQDANAVIVGNTVEVSSTSVPTPTKVAYAYWPNPTGCNLYNKEGLPASPFFVDDVNAKYTITATAGAGGSISPAGTTTYLKRRTCRFDITPNAGQYILDVKVDGVSVGAVNYYAFDPLYANHTINATFTSTAPTYTITASASGGGSISQSGTISVAQGGSKSFKIIPAAGSYVDTVTVDGVSVGNRTSFTFSDIRANHTISASFECKITATVGYGGVITPAGTTDVPYGTNKTFTITPNPGFTITNVKVDGVDKGVITSHTFTNVVGPHTISATFSGGGGTQDGVPRIYDLLFSVNTDSLPASGATGNWATYIPAGKTLVKIGVPTVETINGVKWEKNDGAGYMGYNLGEYSNPIICLGASMITAVRPVKNASDADLGYGPAIFNDRLVLGVKTSNNQVFVKRNGTTDYSTATIPDGQVTILSLVAQPDGKYKVWANGTLIMDVTTTSSITSLNPYGNSNTVTLGASSSTGAYTFNGNIGDTFVYLVPLSDADRQQLETSLAAKFSGGTVTTYTITASAGTGGTISPSGAVTVNQGTSKTFTITPSGGYAIADVKVNNVSVGAVPSYTFTNVTANATIAATFSAVPSATITASAGAGGTISPSGAVLVNYGASKTFTITPNAGYKIADVKVDNSSVGAVTSYTFNNVTANHTISATFSAMPPCTIQASATAGGTVSPSGSVSVSYAGSQTFTITPDTGYKISDVQVDDDSIGIVTSYTFTNVTQNHVFNADFAPIPTHNITATAGTGGSISPSGVVAVSEGSSKTFAITANSGYIVADVKVDNVSVGAVTSYTFPNVTSAHTIAASFSSVTAGVPQTDQLFGSWVTSALPASGTIASWASNYPTGKTLTKMGTPIVNTSNGVKWANTRYASSDGFDLGLFAAPYSIPCNGASIVMAVRPVRNGNSQSWFSCFNVFTYTLSVGIRNDTGNICARRNNTLFNYPTAVIPDGQITILSMVVQPDGTFKIYANGTQIVSEANTSAFTSVAQTWSTTDSQRHINVARANGASWSCFNGYIGDIYFYKIALTTAERLQLEALLTNKFLPQALLNVADFSELKANVGNSVRLTGSAVVTYAPRKADGSRSTSYFYIGEAKAKGCIRVVNKTADDLVVGDTVSGLVGDVSKSDVTGEYILTLTDDSSETVADIVAPLQAIAPVGMNNVSVLTDARALTNLVKVWGKVQTVPDAASFTISDGYNDTGITVIVNGVPLPDGFDVARYAVVTGILTKDSSGNPVVYAQGVNAL